nr:MAG TPA_asm: hypothetical protein [Caudoviricetes sp.]
MDFYPLSWCVMEFLKISLNSCTIFVYTNCL